MKKLINILISFSIIFVSGFNLIACRIKIKDNDNSSFENEKSNLEKAKDFLSNGITITNVLPGKTIKEYIEHLKKTNRDKINSKINFIFDDSYKTTILDQKEIDIIVLLKDDELNQPVHFKLKFLDKALIVDNILKQAKAKIEEKPIIGLGLLATTNISGNIIKNRIIKLIKNQIENSDVKVDWSDQSTLTSLTIEQENKGKVKLSVKANEILKSEIVDFSIIEVLDSEIKVNQKLVEVAA